MAQLMDYAGYLAKEIGPRPAGTEEEQQAALYITEQIQKEAGFAASIEEFSSSSNYEVSRAILALVTFLVTILAMIFPVLAIPAFILTAAAAAIFVLEALDRPIVTRILSSGASQNVVAKYQPNFDGIEQANQGRVRSRKVILIAHYDTGRVKPALVERVESLSLPVPLIVVGAMIAAAFFALLRIFIAPGGGMGLIVLNVLSIIALLLCALPIARVLLMRSAPYNEGANNNATGTAALIEIARRISRGSVSEADLAQEADEDLQIHGEAAAREAGLIPEGAQIRYEAEQLVPPSGLGEHDEEERLLAAKAAIAALTGKPVERRVYGSVADKLVNSFADEDEHNYVNPGEYPESADFAYAPLPTQVAPASAPATAIAAGASADGFENAPSWFIAAQQNAKRSDDSSEPAQIQRSKYTEAMEYAERERADRIEEMRAAEEAQREAERRAREMEMRAAIEADAQMSPAPVVAHEPEPEPALEPGFAPASIGSAPMEPAPASEPAPITSGSAPDSTIAMAAPVPAAEIAAELAAAEAEAANIAAPEPEPVPVPAPEPDSIPEPNPAPTIDVPAVIHEPVVRERISSLPSIDPAAPAGSGPAPVSSPSRSGMLRKLRTNVPSLSGLIDPVVTESAPAKSARKTVGTSNAKVNANNRAAARRAAVDSVPSVVNVPTPAASSDPEPIDYNMEVPRSRAGSLLGRLRRDNAEELTDKPQEWLNVDDDFEARNVGRERGSWESFRDDQYFDDEDDAIDEFGTGDEEGRRTRRRWQGGAYSRKQLGHVDMRSGVDSEADTIIPEELPDNEIDPALTGEIEQIYHFRNPQFNTEIWFVAIGSDGDGHDGARAFLEEHADELRGSMVIEIESLGAGSLSVATEEGRIRKVTASSRVKRYTRSAVSATGIALDEVSLSGTDSIASVVQKAGFQSMHLFGAENGRPALKGSADDVLENVDELLFDDHVNFVYELLKH
ncbi:MAG: hypothetical protein IJ087_18325 [Eggerthellaceae bacterium]|nr:hypothetical protein [Eggerthellaceae bacterium]